MKRYMTPIAILLLITVFFSIPTILFASSVEKTVKLILVGGVVALVYFPNSTVPQVIKQNTTITFNHSILIRFEAFYAAEYLDINGTVYDHASYTMVVNTSEIIYVKAVPGKVPLEINLIGNGNLTIIDPSENLTTTINTSTWISPLFNTSVILESNKPFTVNYDKIATKYFEIIGVSGDFELTVNFNIVNTSSVPPNYAEINLNLNETRNLTAVIHGNFPYTFTFGGFILGVLTTNKSTSFISPINSSIILYSPTLFYANGKPAQNLTKPIVINGETAKYEYYFTVSGNTALQISFYSQQQITTTTTSTSTSTSISTTTTSSSTSTSTITTSSTTTSNTNSSTTTTTTSSTSTTNTTTNSSTTSSTSELPIPTTTSSKTNYTTYILIAIVVIAVILIAFLLLRRR